MIFQLSEPKNPIMGTVCPSPSLSGWRAQLMGAVGANDLDRFYYSSRCEPYEAAGLTPDVDLIPVTYYADDSLIRLRWGAPYGESEVAEKLRSRRFDQLSDRFYRVHDLFDRSVGEAVVWLDEHGFLVPGGEISTRRLWGEDPTLHSRLSPVTYARQEAATFWRPSFTVNATNEADVLEALEPYGFRPRLESDRDARHIRYFVEDPFAALAQAFAEVMPNSAHEASTGDNDMANECYLAEHYSRYQRSGPTSGEIELQASEMDVLRWVAMNRDELQGEGRNYYSYAYPFGEAVAWVDQATEDPGLPAELRPSLTHMRAKLLRYSCDHQSSLLEHFAPVEF